eukprot:tig00021037_g17413.t1
MASFVCLAGASAQLGRAPLSRPFAPQPCDPAPLAEPAPARRAREPLRSSFLGAAARPSRTFVASAPVCGASSRAARFGFNGAVVALAKDIALIFDCDGVIAETEEGHRMTYNESFEHNGVDVHWDEPFYGMLQNSVGGGREKMTWYFNKEGWPCGDSEEEKKALIDKLYSYKNDCYGRIIEEGKLPLRPGIRRLIEEAKAAGIPICVCSAANRKACHGVLDKVLGTKWKEMFEFVIAGDDVKRKKPNPDIYQEAQKRLGVPPERCVVIEDSRIGLLAAKAAGMRCCITYTHYTHDQDFSEADAGVYPEIGEAGAPGSLKLEDIFAFAL